MADASLFFEVDCLVTGGVELQAGGGIVRARGKASKVQKRATAPVRRSGTAEEPCSQSFGSSPILPVFSFFLRFA